jgi:hypothetical protein
VFNDNANITFTVALLPILPEFLWNKILPKARRFHKSREELRVMLQKWESDPAAVADAPKGVKSLIDIFRKGDAPKVVIARWLVMFVSANRVQGK